MINFPFTLFYGVVEDVAGDPLEINRVKVRMYGMHTELKSLIPTHALAWATVSQPTTSPAISGIGYTPFLVNGTEVWGFFRDGDSCQDPVIAGTLPGVRSEKRSGNVGFSDPSEKYPKYLNESDINRLARNKNVEETIVKTKLDGVESGVGIAQGGSWDEPATKYAAEYPLNKVLETEAGHIVEYDDTPGAERVHVYHKSGSFTEVHPDGSSVTKVVGSDYEIVHKDKNLKVHGNCNINVTGNATVNCNNAYVDAKEEYRITTKLFKVIASVKALFETPMVEGTGEVKDSVRTMSGDRTIYNSHQHSVSGHSTAVPTGNKQ